MCVHVCVCVHEFFRINILRAAACPFLQGSPQQWVLGGIEPRTCCRADENPTSSQPLVHRPEPVHTSHLVPGSELNVEAVMFPLTVELWRRDTDDGSVLGTCRQPWTVYSRQHGHMTWDNGIRSQSWSQENKIKKRPCCGFFLAKSCNIKRKIYKNTYLQ